MYALTKKKVHGLLHPEIIADKNWDKILNIFIITLIILNVLAVMLETVTSYHQRFYWFFHYFDMVSVIIFTIEYILRVWSSNHEEKYSHSIWGRLRYMGSAGALIDLVAILPFYLSRILTIDLRMLRMLRLLRIIRLFRLTAYMQSAHMIVNVFKKRFNELLLSFILVMFLVVFASCAIYFAEHLDPKNSAYFTSIPATMWWSVVTLTTTGYGDMYPVTHVGKAMAMLIMLSGVAFFALPAGIISAGFLEEFRLTRIKKTQRCPNCGEPLDLDENGNENGNHSHP